MRSGSDHSEALIHKRTFSEARYDIVGLSHQRYKAAKNTCISSPLQSLSNLFLSINAVSTQPSKIRRTALPSPLTSTSEFGRHALVRTMSDDVTKSEENGLDSEYPWRFEGRLWFRPALVSVPAEDAIPGGVRPLGLFGWTLGGVVCLEYDKSPVGPYREYVTMGSLATKRGAIGQWGSRLFVSNAIAEEVCQRVWNVPAEVAHITFEESPGDMLCVDVPPSPSDEPGDISISVRGWSNTRSSEVGSAGGAIRLPILWTPSIKALWAPFVPLAASLGDQQLPLHRLRLSADSLGLRICGQSPNDLLGVSLPVGLTVDGVRIEIAREDGTM